MEVTKWLKPLVRRPHDHRRELRARRRTVSKIARESLRRELITKEVDLCGQ
jgi:hypothetical protein